MIRVKWQSPAMSQRSQSDVCHVDILGREVNSDCWASLCATPSGQPLAASGLSLVCIHPLAHHSSREPPGQSCAPARKTMHNNFVTLKIHDIAPICPSPWAPSTPEQWGSFHLVVGIRGLQSVLIQCLLRTNIRVQVLVWIWVPFVRSFGGYHRAGLLDHLGEVWF